MNTNRIEFKTDRRIVIVRLINYVDLILTPMRCNADEKHTSDMMDGVEAFSGILIDIPVMWMESIKDRLEKSINGSLYISNHEIEILLSMLDFIKSSELGVANMDDARQLLMEMSVVNTNNTGIHI